MLSFPLPQWARMEKSNRQISHLQLIYPPPGFGGLKLEILFSQAQAAIQVLLKVPRITAGSRSRSVAAITRTSSPGIFF
jgi:hypothetical protein